MIDKFIKKNHKYIFFVIILLAVFFRFYNLPLRVMHHDESGAHGLFSEILCKGGGYLYKPLYHGPFLYHATCLSFLIFGYNDFAVRFMPALFGVLILLFFYLFREEMGIHGYLMSSMLVAISPSFVYYSRFLIHDMFFAFFTLLIFYSLYKIYLAKKTIYWVVLGIGSGFLFTVKENAYPTLLVIISFFILSCIITNLRHGKKNFYRLFLTIKKNYKQFIIFLICFSLIFILVYSSGFRYNFNIIRGIFLPVNDWLYKSVSWDLHIHPSSFYLDIIRNFEFGIAIFGILGLWLAFLSKKRIWLFLCYYALANAMIYFIMPYKTPWLVVHILLPFTFLAGYFLNETYNRIKKSKIGNGVYSVIILLIIITTLSFSVKANFFNYDDIDNKLAYFQENREIRLFVNKFIEYSNGTNVSALYVANNYWTEKWYLRNYNISFNLQALKKACDGTNCSEFLDFQRYRVIVIDKNDEEKLEGFINANDYEILEFIHRDNMTKRAYFRKIG